MNKVLLSRVDFGDYQRCYYSPGNTQFLPVHLSEWMGRLLCAHSKVNASQQLSSRFRSIVEREIGGMGFDEPRQERIDVFRPAELVLGFVPVELCAGFAEDRGGLRSPDSL